MEQLRERAAEAGGEVTAEVLAACALTCVPGMGAAAVGRVARFFGSLTCALEAGPGELGRRGTELQLGARTRRFLSRGPDLEELGNWATAAARAAGARILVPAHGSYPALLRQIANPPAVLYVRGELAAEARRVALVGARAADEPALRLARQMAEELALAGVQVVSGGARGVDAASHAGALWGGGRTVAVLGTGIDVPYPRENEELFERLAAGGGAVVSEFPPGTPSSRPNFPRRNRTIAGLSHAVVVIRAAAASGALITADHAVAQCRPLFAVPGDGRDALAAGPNHLLGLGVARPVGRARDVLRLLGWPVPEQLTAGEDASQQGAQPAVVAATALPAEQALDGPSLGLWRLLDGRRPLHVDELAARARLAAHEVLCWLTELELKGLIQQKPGKYFLRRGAWS